MKKIIVLPVILCGGSGSRLWPLSREHYPKQFLDLIEGQTLFQQAFKRLLSISQDDIELVNPLIVTSENHKFIAKSQIENESVVYILEPSLRNTAAALTLAALESFESGNDPVMVVAPADHYVQDLDAFNKAVQRAVRLAYSGDIAVLGITPTAPETGYGYIKFKGDIGQYGEYEVERFVEKPDVNLAKKFIESQMYVWNSGIFILKVSAWLNALSKFRPDIKDATETAWKSRRKDGAFIKLDANLFGSIPSESIDYAVMEKLPADGIKVKVIPLDAGWSDLGTWDAIWKAGVSDQQGNVTFGDVVLADSINSYIYSQDRLSVVVGADNIVVVDTPDALLIADKTKSQEIKKIYNELSLQKRKEIKGHRKVNRPWGWYDVIDEGDQFKVKRIKVSPGCSLSLQKHEHRSEHWVVIKGVAEIQKGGEIIFLEENQSTYIAVGEVHRLSNPGKTPLEIIEVQSGDILDENDIIRLEDEYGR